MMQPADIEAAIAWRLENIPADDVEALALVLRPGYSRAVQYACERTPENRRSG
ncbi:MAG: hypothetical protein PHQ05_13185 [Sterolibacterium sp.]|nr:hypothetical protein [Sterolibacterium sp.]